jgi:hypothetical protein
VNNSTRKRFWIDQRMMAAIMGCISYSPSPALAGGEAG